MTDRLTPADLAAIRELCAAATPGPWGVEDDGDLWDDGQQSKWWPWRIEGVCNFSEENGSAADARFIAAARTDVPRLLAEVERLSREIERLRDAGTVIVRGERDDTRYMGIIAHWQEKGRPADVSWSAGARAIYDAMDVFLPSAALATTPTPEESGT